MAHCDTTRRGLITGVAGLAGLARIGAPLSALGALAPAFGVRAQSTPRATVPAEGTHLVLLGTQGGPNFNPQRNETASALVVDGKPYLVDCGYGALGALRAAGLNHRDIATVFLTHLHDDHTSDLAALLSHQWTDGRIEPTLVVGPYGTEALVAAALAFSAANAAIRLADEARSVLPRDMFSGRDIAATAEPTRAFADDRVRATAVENTHFPPSAKEKVPYRALSYRLDTDGRSVTFSGDTSYSENLIELARGCDVLVCETIEVATMRQAFERMVADGAYADNPEGIWKHIVETHTSTEDAGRMAAAAGVGTLVLNHLVPGALNELPDSAYLEGVRKHFDGRAIVGRDSMVI
jgi:ribonuclease BN (tRNA processing enzyme)